MWAPTALPTVPSTSPYPTACGAHLSLSVVCSMLLVAKMVRSVRTVTPQT